MEEESFASYILSQTDWGKKLEIMFYLKKKTNIYYNNAVIFKTLISKMFTEYLNDKNPEMNLDTNLIITARLLCDCCKEEDTTDQNVIQNYSLKIPSLLFLSSSLPVPHHSYSFVLYIPVSACLPRHIEPYNLYILTQS